MTDLSQLIWLTPLLLIGLVLLGSKRVPQGDEWTIERFGKYTRTLTPGYAYLWPMIEKIGAKLDIREKVLEESPSNLLSSDNIALQCSVSCFYQITHAAKAAYELDNVQQALSSVLVGSLRAVLAGHNVLDLMQQQDSIVPDLMTKMDVAVEPWGIKVTRVEIKSLQPPEDLLAAVTEENTAVLRKNALVRKSEAQRESKILEADGTKQAMLIHAQGEHEAAILSAQARERQAEADAKATHMLSQAIDAGNLQAVNFFLAQQYVETLGKIGTASSSKLVLLPWDGQQLIGSISGIGELVKESLSSLQKENSAETQTPVEASVEEL